MSGARTVGRHLGRTLGYARVSSEEQARGTSLEDQQNAIRAYGQARGLKIDQFYVEAESAIFAKIEKREQIQLLLKEARKDDLVLCDKLDRWSRDPEFTYGSIRKLLERGCHFYAVGDQCDPSTHDGDTMLGVRVLVAREELKRLRQRTIGTRRLLRDRGYYIEGPVPFGYVRPTGRGISRLEHNILVPDGKNAEIVREIYRMCIRGVSVGKIQVHLESTYKHRRFDKKMVGHVLRSRIYLGEINDTRGVWITGHHKPIVEPTLYTRAQTALDSRKLVGSGPQPESRTKTWLLREIGACARCGSRLSASYGGGTYTGAKDYTYYYRCRAKCKGSHYMKVPDFDPIVADMVVIRLLELRVEIGRGPDPETPAKVVDFTAERARLQRKRDRFLEAFADAGMTKEELRAALSKVDLARIQLDSKEVEQRRTSPLVMVAVRREMLQKVENMQTTWRRASPEIKRQALHLLAASVRIEHGQVPVINWRSLEQLAADVYP